jgi:hypothetical protein
MGGTLERFTWFRCTWLGSRKGCYREPMLGCDTDKSDSLASRSQACIPEQLFVE